MNWLLVFDNADDLSKLDPYWPSAKHGGILATSRNSFQGSGSRSFATSGVAVKPFTADQGAQFLLRALPADSPITEADSGAARDVSNIFNGASPWSEASIMLYADKTLPAGRLLRTLGARQGNARRYPGARVRKEPDQRMGAVYANAQPRLG